MSVLLWVLALHALGLWALGTLSPTVVKPQVIPVTMLANVLPARQAVLAPRLAAPAPQPAAQENKPRQPPPAAAVQPVSRPRPVEPVTARPEGRQAQAAQRTASPAAVPNAPTAQPTARLSEVAASETTSSPTPASQQRSNVEATGADAPASQPAATEHRVEPPSRRGGYLSNPPPPYPPISRRLGEQGEVMVRAFINADGTASRVELLRSSGFDRLDRAALAAAQDWRYLPGTRAGQPEGMWFNLPVVFELK